MRKEKAHIWAGRVHSEQRLQQFMEETYSDNEDDEPISEFAQSQGETFIDHDFLESGFEDETAAMRERFIKYSYGEEWIDEFEKRIDHQNIVDPNAIILLLCDHDDMHIESPCSITREGIDMMYLGVFEFEG